VEIDRWDYSPIRQKVMASAGPGKKLIDGSGAPGIVNGYPGWIESGGQGKEFPAQDLPDRYIFIEQSPNDNGWMVPIPPDHFFNLPPAMLSEAGSVFDPSDGTLLIDQESDLIGQIKHVRDGGQKVEPDGIKPGFFGQCKFATSPLSIGRVEYGGRVVGLEDDGLELHLPAVEIKPSIQQVETAKADPFFTAITTSKEPQTDQAESGIRG
jgi:hypothetical protein